MGNQRRDGSVLSSALTGSQHRRVVELDYGMYRCMIVKVNYVGDDGNLTFDNSQVTYECMILGGKKEGQVIVNVKAQGQGGGEFNYYERIYRATEFKFSGDGKKPLTEQNGDVVYVQYINGSTSLPIITGGGVSALDKDKTGSTKEDGHRLIDEYNGIRKSIDKDGNLKFERFGGTWNEEGGYFVPNEEAESEITMTGDDPSITINVTDKGDITINNDGITMNSMAEVLINAAKAFKAIAEGDVEISGANITITTSGKAEFAGDGGTDVGSSGAPTNVNGASVALAGGGAPVARVGDAAVGVGAHGVQVSSTIVSGSGTVNSA